MDRRRPAPRRRAPRRASTRSLDHLVLTERPTGSIRLARASRSTTANATTIFLPDPVYSVWVGPNAEFETAVLRYGYTSLVAPVTDFDYDPETHATTVVKTQPVLRRLRPVGRTPRRGSGPRSRTATRVPMSVVHRRMSRSTERRPHCSYGYGVVRASRCDPTFRPLATLAARPRLRLRDRARPRRRRARPPVVRRRAASSTRRTRSPTSSRCAEALVADGYTSPSRLVARGGSAGGLLMGAVANLRPDLFAAIVAEVPFVDVVTTMLDADLPLTVTEWEEWGDPREAGRLRADEGVLAVRQRAAARRTRPMLVTDRAQRPTRAVLGTGEVGREAAGRSRPRGDPIILRTELGAGHGGPSGRYDAWREEAMVLAFVCDAVGVDGMTEPAAPRRLPHGRRRGTRSRVRAADDDVARRRSCCAIPHPQYGGTMRSIVISALFDALPAAGYSCLRFNFRGVEGSAGQLRRRRRRADRRRRRARRSDRPDGPTAPIAARRLVVRRRHGAVGHRPARRAVGSGSRRRCGSERAFDAVARRRAAEALWCSREHDEFRDARGRATRGRVLDRTSRPRSSRAPVTSSSAAPTASSTATVGIRRVVADAER